MNRIWILLSLVSFTAYAEDPNIPTPIKPRMEMDRPTDLSTATKPAPLPMSTSAKDPDNKKWIDYNNRIVKIHVHAKSAWTMMEVKESETIGTVIFTISRLPLITFSVVRGPLDGTFNSYLTPEVLKPLFPESYKKSNQSFAGHKAVLVRGKGDDGRMNESYFLTEGMSLYQVTFSAPEEDWEQAEKEFSVLRRSFRWIR